MPPSPVVNKEDILSTAFSIVQARGIECVNARSLAEALGCSTKPLFRLFKNMDELKKELISKINQYCSAYLLGYEDFDKDPVGVALRYISFAGNEPGLFKALFMGNSITQTTIADMLTDKDIERLLNEISITSKVSIPEARGLYKKMWLLSHGIASVLAANSKSFKEEEIKSLLAEAYAGFVMSVKYGGQDSAISE